MNYETFNSQEVLMLDIGPGSTSNYNLKAA